MGQDDKELYGSVKAMLVRDLRLKISAEDIKDDDRIFGDGLGLDSIDALELVVALEKNFKVKIPDANVGAKVLVSVDSIVAYIKGKRANA